jgi:hypothetical protein
MTNNEEFLVPVSIAKELNEIGFDKPCFFSFNEEVIREIPLSFGKFLIKCNDHEAHLDGVIYEDKKVTDSYPIPTYEQVFAWFRSKGLFHSITIEEDLIEGNIFFDSEIRNTDTDIVTMFTRDTYEEAREELLKRLIKIYKENI